MMQVAVLLHSKHDSKPDSKHDNKHDSKHGEHRGGRVDKGARATTRHAPRTS